VILPNLRIFINFNAKAVALPRGFGKTGKISLNLLIFKDFSFILLMVNNF